MAIVQSNGSTPTARKPHRDWAGYVSERRNHLTGDHNVIVLAAAQGLDVSEGAGSKFACICNAHNTVIQGSLSAMRGCMEDATGFCDDCRELAARGSTVSQGA